MRDAVIVDAVRTPLGKKGGALAGYHPADLSAHVLTALAQRNALEPALVDDVIWGCVSQVGEQSENIGRFAVLGAGWPEEVPATTIDRQCGSSQQAAHFAAAALMAGHYDIVIAGGVESMSRVPMGSPRTAVDHATPYGDRTRARYPGGDFNQGIGAELIAAEYGLGRSRLDAYALESHARAVAASDAGLFSAEIVPVDLPGRDGTVYTDEGLRRDTSLEKLAGLRTPFRQDGVVTAGNASQISDGASAMLLTTSETAAANGWRPLARIHTAVVTGCDPVTMLKGPIPATAKALKRAGLVLDDIGVFEVNEAFASVALAWLDETAADRRRLNPLGGAIALGHPLGCSGARLMTTMLHHMCANGLRFGLQTMCEGGGMANATVLELL